MFLREQQRLLVSCDVRVDLRSRYGAVPQQGLNVSYVHASHKQRGGECMAKHVRGNIGLRAEFGKVLSNNAPDRLRRERSPSIVY